MAASTVVCLYCGTVPNHHQSILLEYSSSHRTQVRTVDPHCDRRASVWIAGMLHVDLPYSVLLLKGTDLCRCQLLSAWIHQMSCHSISVSQFGLLLPCPITPTADEGYFLLVSSFFYMLLLLVCHSNLASFQNASSVTDSCCRN